MKRLYNRNSQSVPLRNLNATGTAADGKPASLHLRLVLIQLGGLLLLRSQKGLVFLPANAALLDAAEEDNKSANRNG